MVTSPKEAARDVLEVVPLVMRTVRAEMRASGAHNLSVPQFRALAFVQRHPGASLSDVAEHIGMALPSGSKLIDVLVARKLVVRESHTGDRRRITLELTPRGQSLWQSARECTLTSLSARLAGLAETDRAAVMLAMRILYPLFADQRN